MTLDREHGAHKGGHEYECMYTQIKMNGSGGGRVDDGREGWMLAWIGRVHTRRGGRVKRGESCGELKTRVQLETRAEPALKTPDGNRFRFNLHNGESSRQCLHNSPPPTVLPPQSFHPPSWKQRAC